MEKRESLAVAGHDMPQIQMSAPVAFFVFNRPAVTRRVFAAITQARPNRLFIIGDGARPSRHGEEAKVAEVRSIVARVEWPCNVSTNFSKVNLGCRLRVSSGLSWVFEHVDRAIILEDDCLPSPAFFRYCTALLQRYETDRRIFCISGVNFGRALDSPGHYFSNFALMWGWATWRDRWSEYELLPKDWRSVLVRMWIDRPIAFAYWWRIFRNLERRRMDSWAYQWILTLWRNRALACRPSMNLVENIGFGPDATHTKNSESRIARAAAVDMGEDLSTALSQVVADHSRDAVDEREWALLNIRSLLLMYFPWLNAVRRR
jgi:hypothetical protein